MRHSWVQLSWVSDVCQGHGGDEKKWRDLPPLEWLPGLPDLWTELLACPSRPAHEDLCLGLAEPGRAHCSGGDRCLGSCSTVFQPAFLLLPK